MLTSERGLAAQRLLGEQGVRAGGPDMDLVVHQCDALIAFWDGESRGTLDVAWKAYLVGKTVLMAQMEPAKNQGLVGASG